MKCQQKSALNLSLRAVARLHMEERHWRECLEAVEDLRHPNRMNDVWEDGSLTRLADGAMSLNGEREGLEVSAICSSVHLMGNQLIANSVLRLGRARVE